MTQEVIQFISACEWDTVSFFVMSKNVFDPLIYYSHLLPLTASLLLGIFIFIKSRKQLAAKVLFVTILFLVAWLFSDLVVWATDKPPLTMLFWSVTNMVEPMIYAGILYFLYLFIDEKDISFTKKAILICILIPTVFLTPTSLGMLGYDISNCDRDAIEGPLAYYGYTVEIIFILWAFLLAIKRFVQKTEVVARKKIVLVTIGSLGFLIAFAFGNVIGSLLDTYSVIGDEYSWSIGQYGIFGIPIFVGFLAYLIVKFKTFNVKLFGAQALVTALAVLIGSQLFFIKVFINQVLTSITLGLVVVFGIVLVRSVRREIESREKIEIQEKELEIANARLKELDQLKSEFVSLATHQIRGPLTAIKGYASLMIEGDYGELPASLKEPIDTVYQSSQSLVVIVEDFLNVSRIEQGKMKYDFSTFDFCSLVNEVVNEARPIIEKRGLNVSATICPAPVTVRGDRGKIKQVIGNLFDNSMKYTPKGSINLTVESDKTSKKVLLSIKDTGVGINAETIPHLFHKFSRAEGASKVNIMGTGLGLYVANEMIKAHGGRIWVESPGVGKGATFFVELALA